MSAVTSPSARPQKERGGHGLEFETVRLASAPVLDEARRSAIEAAVGEGPDWKRLLHLAGHHRLLPLLFSHLRDSDARVPEDVLAALKGYVRAQSIDVLHLTSEMALIGRRFEEDGIPYLVLKGPSVTAAYGEISLRPFSDNDLLVQRSDFAEVERALLGIGFNERKRGDRQQAGYLLVHGEYTFGRSVGEFVSTVDVHTRVVPFGLSYGPAFADLQARGRQVGVAGHDVPVLDWADLFVTLSVNALKDQWNRLRLASDLVAVGKMVEDWREVEDRARHEGVARAVRLAVAVSTEIAGAGIPPPVVERARRDARVETLKGRVVPFLASSHETPVRPGLARARFHMLAQDGLAGRARYVGYAAARRLTEGVFSPR